jgi:hypothetical protein
MKLPSGPGVPAREAQTAFEEATAGCRRVTSISSEVALGGSVGGRRLPRPRLLVGLAAPSAMRLEAAAAFGPLLILVAQGSEATLLLPHENRVLEHGSPSAILEAMVGVALDAADLRKTITGCADRGDFPSARRVGDWIVVPDARGDLYLRRDGRDGPWRLVAAVHRGVPAGEWRAEFQMFQDGIPRQIRLTSEDRRRFDLRLALSQVDINASLGPEVFRVKIPDSAVPVSLTELRESGPFGDSRAK